MEIIIEEISRGHKLIGRHKIDKDAIAIGRGYQNDIILSDPHVCADHLTIVFNGEHWTVNDSGSVNGTFLEDGKQSADNHVVNSGDIINLGKSQIRLLFPNHPVERSVNFSPFENMINLMRHPLALFLSISLFVFVAGFIFYLNKPIEVTFTQLLVPAIGMTMLFALWPGGVALVSHLTKHDARVLTQLGICFAFFNLMWLSDVIETIVDFNLSGNWFIGWVVTLLPIGLAFCLFWLNCYIGFHMTKKRRMIVSLSITTLLFGGGYLIQINNHPEFSARPNYNATIMTPSFMFAPSTDVETFVEDSARLFKKAQQAAKEDK